VCTRAPAPSPLTSPRGSASAGMGPKWSLGMFTMIRPLDALARPARTARSVVKASSGRSSLLMLQGWVGGWVGGSGRCGCAVHSFGHVC
jgi:hypothetical protein